MLDMQIKIAYSMSEERNRLAKRGREERPWVLERQKTRSNQTPQFLDPAAHEVSLPGFKFCGAALCL